MDWVHAAERAYVAAAVAGARGGATAAVAARTAGGAAPAIAGTPGDSRALAIDVHARAIAAAGAVASHYLAVGTPRSFGIIIDAVGDAAAAALSLTAHRTWFAPRDIRCAATGTGAAELAVATGGRVVSVDEALACDIVHVHSTSLRVRPTQLRRGTHVNALSAAAFASELLALATVVPEAGLPALAAGLVDGRQLDELTIFTIDGAPIAVRALTPAG